MKILKIKKNGNQINVNINNDSIKRINIHDYTTIAKHKWFT